MAEHIVYCIDTSALIDLKQLYPSGVFPGLWENLGQLVKEDRLIAPHEVLKEIEKKDDVLLQWARKHKRMFKGLDQKQLQTVMDILHKFPRLVDPGKVIPDADPFVVALAKEMNRQGSLFGKCIVVTQEKLSSGKPKIPNVCQHYGIEYTPVIDVLKKEKWKF